MVQSYVDAVALGLQLAMGVATTGGEITQTNGRLLKDWARNEIEQHPEIQEQSLKDILNQAMTDAYHRGIDSELDLIEMAKDFSRRADAALKSKIMTLCYEVAGGDDLHGGERKVLIANFRKIFELETPAKRVASVPLSQPATRSSQARTRMGVPSGETAEGSSKNRPTQSTPPIHDKAHKWIKGVSAVAMAVAGIWLANAVWWTEGANTPTKMVSPNHTSSPANEVVNRSNDKDLSKSTPQQQQSTPAPTLVEQSLPYNGAVTNNLPGERIAGLKVNTKGESHYLVKLAPFYSTSSRMAIFIRAGQSIDIKVPLGTYEFRFASGKKWYGYDKLFGHDTRYSKGEGLMEFTKTATAKGYRIKGHKVTLYAVAGGNYHTKKIDPSEF